MDATLGLKKTHHAGMYACRHKYRTHQLVGEIIFGSRLASHQALLVSIVLLGVNKFGSSNENTISKQLIDQQN